jgi:hypothetical protein
MRLPEGWSGKMTELIVIHLTIASDLPIQFMDSKVGFGEHSLDDTFQTIAFSDFVVTVHLEGINDGLLLLVDKVLELLDLCSHRFEFGHIVLDAALQELTFLVFWD